MAKHYCKREFGYQINIPVFEPWNGVSVYETALEHENQHARNIVPRWWHYVATSCNIFPVQVSWNKKRARHSVDRRHRGSWLVGWLAGRWYDRERAEGSNANSQNFPLGHANSWLVGPSYSDSITGWFREMLVSQGSISSSTINPGRESSPKFP